MLSLVRILEDFGLLLASVLTRCMALVSNSVLNDWRTNTNNET